MKPLHFFLCLLLSSFITSTSASSRNFYVPFTKCNVSARDIVFESGRNGTAYLVSTNMTWAKVNITGTAEETYYEYVLNITSFSNNINYTVKLQIASITGTNRLSNFTAYLHSGSTSKQVEISNGTVTQSMGSWYSIMTSTTIYLSLAIEIYTSGSSAVDLRLHKVRTGMISPEIIQTIKVNVNQFRSSQRSWQIVEKHERLMRSLSNRKKV